MAGKGVDDFDPWLRYVFDRPPEDLTGTAWYHRADDREEEWLSRPYDPVATAERIRHLFSHAGTVLRQFSDDQVGHGLREIVDSGAGGDIRALTDRRVPPVLRTTGIRSIGTLFAEVFAVRVHNVHAKNASALESICFMFWDIVPLGPGEEDTILDVLEQILALDSVPCQWAALHGLGHTYLRTPEHVPAIVDRWLGRNRTAPEALREYAAQARTGMVN